MKMDVGLQRPCSNQNNAPRCCVAPF